METMVGQTEQVLTEAELMMKMGWVMGRIRAVGQELGITDPNDVFVHPKVFPVFMSGLLKATNPDLPESKRQAVVKSLTELASELARAPDAQVLPIEKRVHDLELAILAADRLRGALDDEQITLLFRVMASERMGNSSQSTIGSSDEEGLGESALSMYGSRLEAEGPDLDALRAMAPVFVSRHLAARERVLAEYGAKAINLALGDEEREEGPTLATRIQDAKVLVAILTPQARAERDLYDRASPELRGRMAGNELLIIMFFLTDGK